MLSILSQDCKEGNQHKQPTETLHCKKGMKGFYLESKKKWLFQVWDQTVSQAVGKILAKESNGLVWLPELLREAMTLEHSGIELSPSSMIDKNMSSSSYLPCCDSGTNEAL